MGDITNNLIDTIKELARRIRNLELSVFTYGEQPDSPPSEAAITGLTSSVVYYTEPTTLLPRATATFNWTKPNTPDDPVVSYYVSVTRTGDAGTGGFVNVGDVDSYVVSGLPVDTNVTFRIYGITRAGVIGPTATHARAIARQTAPPLQPATPGVEGALRGIRVSNNGLSSTGGAMSDDLAYYEVHAVNNGATNFTPTATTLWGKMGPNESVYITANASYQNIAVRLVAVNTTGVKSTPSTGVIGTPLKVTDTDSGITIPSGTAYSDQNNYVVDGSFESSEIRALRNAGMNSAWAWANTAGGAQHGSWFLKATNTVGSGNRDVYLNTDVQGTSPIAEFLISPDSKYYVSFRARNVSAVGNLSLTVRVRKSDGTYSYPSKTVTPTDAATGNWEQFSFILTPDANAVSARAYFRTVGTAGEWHVDAVEFRQVLGTVLIEDGAITRAKIGSAAISTAQIEEVDAGLIKSGFISADRIQSSSIITEKLAASAVTANKLATNAVTTDKLEASAVTAGKLAAGAVTADKLEASAITGKTITGGTITGSTIRTSAGTTRIEMNSSRMDVYRAGVKHMEIDPSRSYTYSPVRVRAPWDGSLQELTPNRVYGMSVSNTKTHTPGYNSSSGVVYDETSGLNYTGDIPFSTATGRVVVNLLSHVKLVADWSDIWILLNIYDEYGNFVKGMRPLQIHAPISYATNLSMPLSGSTYLNLYTAGNYYARGAYAFSRNAGGTISNFTIYWMEVSIIPA